LEGLKKYTVEMGSGVALYISSSVKISSDIQKLMEWITGARANSMMIS
jgi:hypothetical protein